jgi:hypothetical protein
MRFRKFGADARLASVEESFVDFGCMRFATKPHRCGSQTTSPASVEARICRSIKASGFWLACM